jgi:signal transduction histidine kinase
MLKDLFNILSIRRKLTLIIIIVSIIPIIIWSIIELNVNIRHIKKDIIEKGQVEAELISEYCAMPLEFDYPDRANEILQNLETLPGVLNGVIIDSNGNIFAEYKRKDFKNLNVNYIKDDPAYFDDEFLFITQPVSMDNKYYGKLYLRIKTPLKDIIRIRIIIFSLSVIGLIILSSILAGFLQKTISRPIEKLAVTARHIPQTEDYSIRVSSNLKDEIGTLYENFNFLLNTVETREKERDHALEDLKKYRNHLEELVHQRTQKITQINHELSERNTDLKEKQKELEETIQKLKETQNQLIQTEKLASLGVLTAGIAHEINNPVNFISSGLDGLEESIDEMLQLISKCSKLGDEKNPENIREIKRIKNEFVYEELVSDLRTLTNNIRNGIDRTSEIVKSLRIYSRMDEDNVQKTDINESIDSTLIILNNQYKNRIKIERNFGSLPKIECIPGKINQVFMNILSNSIQAIENKGVINISTGTLNEAPPDQKRVFVQIEDNGIGIPEELHSKVFEPFFTTKEVGKGTGLGLSIVHSIIEQHKGSVELKSEVNKGTTFTIVLPVTLSLKQNS